MRVDKFLHNLLNNAIHQKRITTLSQVVKSSLQTKNLSLTALGRGIDNSCQERSNIRKVDRLLGNQNLLLDKDMIYKSVNQYLLSGVSQPIIIVDAVKLPNVDYYALRASCPVGGRSYTLYEAIYSKGEDPESMVHKNFLFTLKKLIPNSCCPVIITDAGFHNPWFKLVLANGWDFIGRIRGLKICRFMAEKLYIPCSLLWAGSKKKPEHLGEVILNKKNPLQVNIYRYKKNMEGRQSQNKKRRRDDDDYSRSTREPWLLASSLGENYSPQAVIGMYKRRMKIEESFRDLKSNKYGLGMEKVKTIHKNRLEIFLLIAMLSNLIACLIGKVIEARGQHYAFQANSTKCRRVLSLVYLGCQAIRKKIPILCSELLAALYSSKIDFSAPL